MVHVDHACEAPVASQPTARKGFVRVGRGSIRKAEEVVHAGPLSIVMLASCVDHGITG